MFCASVSGCFVCVRMFYVSVSEFFVQVCQNVLCVSECVV